MSATSPPSRSTARDISLRGSSIEAFAASLRGDVLLARQSGLRRPAPRLERVLRQASGAHRELHGRIRRPARGRFCARAPVADRGARGRPQPVGQVHLRRRARDRPAADAGRARRPGSEARLSRGRLAARTARPRVHRIWSCDRGRHGVRTPAPRASRSAEDLARVGRRFGLACDNVDVLRCRDSRRTFPAGERRGEHGPVLGPARRRRQLRRRDGHRVPPAPDGPDDSRRIRRMADGPGARRDASLRATSRWTRPTWST